jgi:hypothetical protein
MTSSKSPEKNHAGSVGKKHISIRHSIKIYEFFMVFEKCGRKKVFNAMHLPL